MRVLDQHATFDIRSGQSVLFDFDPERIIIFFIGHFIIIWDSLPTLKTEDLFAIAHTSGQEL